MLRLQLELEGDVNNICILDLGLEKIAEIRVLF